MNLAAVPDPSHEAAPDAPGELVCRIVLSRCIAGPRSRQLATVTVASHGLELYASTPVIRNGRQSSTPRLVLAPGSHTTGATALKRLGITQDALREKLRVLEDRHGEFAAFDRELLEVFFPPALWPVITTMITDGPKTACERAERAVRLYARTTVRATKRRREGPPARSTVDLYRTFFAKAFSIFVDLCLADFPFAPLTKWTAAPKIEMPDIELHGGLDTQGPRPGLLRQKWTELNAEIAQKLKIKPGEDELAALETLTWGGTKAAGLAMALRARVVLGLMVLTAGRVQAIADLRVSDYEKERIGPPPDYRTGPCLLVRPGKRLPPSAVRPKAIPPEFAAMIDVYLAYMRRAIADARASTPHKCPEKMPDDFPLLMANRYTLSPLGARGIRDLLSGVSYGERGLRRPLIAREGGLNQDLPAEKHEWVGYNPHAYRHTGSQMAERAGELWENTHPTTGAEPKPPPGLYASTLQDQKPPGDPLRAIYGDRNTEAKCEVLSGRAIEGIWKLLTTAEGARKKIDTDAYIATWRRCRALEQERAAGRARADAIYREPDVAGTAEERHAYQTRAMKVMFENLDYADRLGEELRREEARLRNLRHDESLWECIPDDAPPRTEHVDIEALEASLGNEPDSSDSEVELVAVRDWITPRELADIRGIRNRSTVARWLRDQHLPARPEDRPWEPAAIPVDDSLGRNYRRIWIPGVNASFWRTELIKARLAACLTRWPTEQGWLDGDEPGPRCLAPLKLPDHIQRPDNLT
jgi:hypothetical protein